MPIFLTQQQSYRLIQRLLPENVFPDGAPSAFFWTAEAFSYAKNFSSAYDNAKSIYQNFFPQTCDDGAIASWELKCFGAVNPQGLSSLTDRQAAVTGYLSTAAPGISTPAMYQVVERTIKGLVPSASLVSSYAEFTNSPSQSMLTFSGAFLPAFSTPWQLDIQGSVVGAGQNFGIAAGNLHFLEIEVNDDGHILLFLHADNTHVIMIDVFSGIDFTSGFHAVRVQWSGSLLASGFLVSVDGVAQANVVSSDSLAGMNPSIDDDLLLIASDGGRIRGLGISGSVPNHNWPLLVDASDTVSPGGIDGVATNIDFGTPPGFSGVFELAAWCCGQGQGGWVLDESQLDLETYLNPDTQFALVNGSGPGMCPTPENGFQPWLAWGLTEADWIQLQTYAYTYEVRLYNYTLTPAQRAILTAALNTYGPARSPFVINDGLSIADVLGNPLC